jgi:UDP-glucuronate decarboxylase
VGESDLRGANILVLGGAGFVGSYLCNALFNYGCNVVVIDQLVGNSLNLLHKLIPVVRDSFQSESFSTLLDKADIFIDLASAKVGVDVTINGYRDLFTNITKVRRICSLNSTLKRPIIFTSTSDVYGLSGQYYDEFSESTPMMVDLNNKRWVYAKVKSLEEDIYGFSPFPSVSVRIFNTFGFGVDFHRPSRIFSHILFSMISGAPIEVYGGGTQKRTYTYISDIVDGIILIVQELLSKRLEKDLFNIGNPVNVASVLELIQVASDEASKLGVRHDPLKVVHKPIGVRADTQFNDVDIRKPSITRIMGAIGYKPKVSLREGVRSSIVAMNTYLATQKNNLYTHDNG